MNKKLINETIAYFIGSVMVSILGFILSILYSRMFTPREYGIYSLAYSIYCLITQTYSGWIAVSLVRKYEKYRNIKAEDLLFNTFFKLQFVMAILLFVVSSIIFFIFNFNTLLEEILITLVLSYFFEQTLVLINTMLRVKQEVKQYNYNTILNNMLKIILILVLYYFAEINNIIVIAISFLISEIIQVIYLSAKYRLFRYYFSKTFDNNLIKEMFVFGFPLVGVSLTSWILNTSDRFIIRFYCTNSEVGLYSYAYSLGNSLFNLLIQFVMLGAYPNIVKVWENQGEKETEVVIKKYLNIYLAILLPAIFGVVGVAKNFFISFTDVRYQEEYDIFIITCISIAMLGFTQYCNKPWELNNKTKMIFIFNIIIAAINVFLNFLLIPFFNYNVASVTTLIAYVLYIFISIIFNKNKIRIKIDMYFLLKILAMSIIMFLIVKSIDLSGLSEMTKFVFQVVVGGVVYFILLFIFNIIKIQNIKKTFDEFLNRNKE